MASLDFTHDTTNVFFTKQSFCENIPTLPNHCISLLSWLTLRGMGDLGHVEAWIRSYFARKWPDIFLKGILGIFPEMNVSEKKRSSLFIRAFHTVLT